MTHDAGEAGSYSSERSEKRQSAPSEGLIAAFMSNYAYLVLRLTAKLGSRDEAEDILQQVYLKLNTAPRIGDIRSARPYLYRMAINMAKNRWRSEGRTVNLDEVRVVEISDEAPDQERALIASDEIARLFDLLQDIPQARRDIFLAKWRDEQTLGQIAAKTGLHKRTVQKELERAERYLRKKLSRPK
ncbi:RNA polymerase sigma factor [Novosphingobium profundi]|uniref:RNA polymerase sigma factor n=1 Tax=Novosphingobium profundi TaxID=1774954 RepID=UPI001BDA48EE|nr:RNA polymerase sigma factor [Novosphingobium profundi]MBT0667354.1 RNA polymerase sigma factor [Novosphingobium profundi]